MQFHIAIEFLKTESITVQNPEFDRPQFLMSISQILFSRMSFTRIPIPQTAISQKNPKIRKSVESTIVCEFDNIGCFRVCSLIFFCRKNRYTNNYKFVIMVIREIDFGWGAFGTWTFGKSGFVFSTFGELNLGFWMRTIPMSSRIV